MNESILSTIKHMLSGLTPEITSFDNDIIVHINSTLVILYELGVGDAPFSITGAEETWDDFLDDSADLVTIKTYIAAKVRKMFDPPNGSSATESMNNVIAELEWRINVAAERKLQNA